MDSEAWVAMVTAAIFGIPSVPYPRRHFWREWNGWLLAIVGMVLFLAIQALMGWVTKILADATNWEPTKNGVSNGILFGLTAAGLLRVQLGTGETGRALRAMSLLVGTMVDWMDGIAGERVDGYLNTLRETELIRLTRRIDHSYIRRLAPRGVQRIFTDNVRKAIARMQSHDENEQLDGFEALRGVVYDWYLKNHATVRLRQNAESREEESPRPG